MHITRHIYSLKLCIEDARLDTPGSKAVPACMGEIPPLDQMMLIPCKPVNAARLRRQQAKVAGHKCALFNSLMTVGVRKDFPPVPHIDTNHSPCAIPTRFDGGDGKCGNCNGLTCCVRKRRYVSEGTSSQAPSPAKELRNQSTFPANPVKCCVAAAGNQAYLEQELIATVFGTWMRQGIALYIGQKSAGSLPVFRFLR